MKVTYVKSGVDIVAADGSVIKNGWVKVVITDPTTGDMPTDAQGRYIKWTEINTVEGWGCIIDIEAFERGEERYLRVEAPWIRLLEMDVELPSEADGDDDNIVF